MAPELSSIDGGKTTPATAPRRKITTSFQIPQLWYDRVESEASRLSTSRTNVYMRALAAYFEAFSKGSWEVENDDYDPTRFYTKSEDAKGHSYHARVNIPKPLAGEIAELISSGAVPQYRSVADVIRDAVYHRVKQISRLIDDGKLEQGADMAMLLSEEIQLEEEAVHAEQLIDAMRNNINRMFQQGTKPDTIKRVLAEREDKANNVAESYRAKYLEVIADFKERLERESKPKRRRRRD